MSEECVKNGYYCPFVQNPHQLDQYVCLKCGIKRDLEKKEKSEALDFIILFLVGILIAIVFFRR
jgi:predicted nucleic acid-binding Zn ribbon protein